MSQNEWSPRRALSATGRRGVPFASTPTPRNGGLASPTPRGAVSPTIPPDAITPQPPSSTVKRSAASVRRNVSRSDVGPPLFVDDVDGVGSSPRGGAALFSSGAAIAGSSVTTSAIAAGPSPSRPPTRTAAPRRASTSSSTVVHAPSHRPLQQTLLEAVFGVAVIDIEPDEQRRTAFVRAPTVQTEIQNVPELSEHSTNTEIRRAAASRGMRFVEGGWPRDVDGADADQALRYRRKLEKDDAYFAAVHALTATVCPIVRQNAALDIYEVHFGSRRHRNTEATVARPALVSDDVPDDGSAPPGAALGGGEGDGIVESSAMITVVATLVDPTVPTATAAAATKVVRPPAAAAGTASLKEANDGKGGSWMRSVQFSPTAVFDGDESANDGAEQRAVAALSWAPADTARLAVAYSYTTIGEGDPRLRQRSRTGRQDVPSQTAAEATSVAEHSVGCVFDAARPNTPEMYLRPLFAMRSIEYHPRDAHQIVAGTTAGTVVVFDTRRGQAPVLSSKPAAHRDVVPHRSASPSAVQQPSWTLRHSPVPIRQVRWLQSSGKAVELASADGTHRVLVWDVRSLNAPIEAMVVGLRRPPAGTSRSSDTSVYPDAYRHGATCLEFSATSPNTGKLFVGTNTGCVFGLSRRGKADGDRVTAVFGSHAGPVMRVARHPTAAGLFATAADHCVRLWVDDQVEALCGMDLQYEGNDGSSDDDGGVVDCVWHPAAPGLLLVLRRSGRLTICAVSVGDRSVASAFAPQSSSGLSILTTLQVLARGNGAATSMAIAGDGMLLAVGSTRGASVLLSLSAILTAVRQAAATKRARCAADAATTTVTDDRAAVSQWISQLKRRARVLSDAVGFDRVAPSSAADRSVVAGEEDDYGPAPFSRCGVMGTASFTESLLHRATALMRSASGGPSGLTSDDITFDDMPQMDSSTAAGAESHRRRRGGGDAMVVASSLAFVGEEEALTDLELQTESAGGAAWMDTSHLAQELRRSGALYMAALTGDDMPVDHGDSITSAWVGAIDAAEEIGELDILASSDPTPAIASNVVARPPSSMSAVETKPRRPAPRAASPSSPTPRGAF